MTKMILEICLVSLNTKRHFVVTSIDGVEIHRTVQYADRDYAQMHAKEIEKRARAVLEKNKDMRITSETIFEGIVDGASH
jgi:hypothetical protein